MSKVYDMVVIGAGPAGLTAGLYGARAKMSTLILEKSRVGGQIATTDEIENYPGAQDDSSGPSLIAQMLKQAEEFGAEVKKEEVVEFDLEAKVKTIKTDKETYQAKTVIVATGAVPRKLNAPGEKELTGKGISYCATCDGAFFTDLETYVIGGGNSAIEEAMFLTKFCKKVTVLQLLDHFTCAKSILEKAKKNDKIELITNRELVEINGEGIVESIKVKNTETGDVEVINAPEEDGTFGVFIFIGYTPNTQLFKGTLDMNDWGYLVTDPNMNTNIEGVFAAGDLREKDLRQVVTATADGAIAAVQAEKYVDHHFEG